MHHERGTDAIVQAYTRGDELALPISATSERHASASVVAATLNYRHAELPPR